MGVVVYSVIFFLLYIISCWAWIEALYDKFNGRRILLEVTVAILPLITAGIVTSGLYTLIHVLSSLGSSGVI